MFARTSLPQENMEKAAMKLEQYTKQLAFRAKELQKGILRTKQLLLFSYRFGANRAFCVFFIQKQNYPRKLLDSFCQLLLKEKPAALQWRLATQIREQQHLNWGPSNELPGTYLSFTSRGRKLGRPENISTGVSPFRVC